MYKVVFEYGNECDRASLVKKFSELVNDEVTNFCVKQGVTKDDYEGLINKEIADMAIRMGTTVERLPSRYKRVAKQMVKAGYFIEKSKAEAKAEKDIPDAKANDKAVIAKAEK